MRTMMTTMIIMKRVKQMIHRVIHYIFMRQRIAVLLPPTAAMVSTRKVTTAARVTRRRRRRMKRPIPFGNVACH